LQNYVIYLNVIIWQNFKAEAKALSPSIGGAPRQILPPVSFRKQKFSALRPKMPAMASS
jgi:hypothetical protein